MTVHCAVLIPVNRLDRRREGRRAPALHPERHAGLAGVRVFRPGGFHAPIWHPSTPLCTNASMSSVRTCASPTASSRAAAGVRPAPLPRPREAARGRRAPHKRRGLHRGCGARPASGPRARKGDGRQARGRPRAPAGAVAALRAPRHQAGAGGWARGVAAAAGDRLPVGDGRPAAHRGRAAVLSRRDQDRRLQGAPRLPRGCPANSPAAKTCCAPVVPG